MIAAIQDHIVCMHELLDKAADIDSNDNDGYTTLLNAMKGQLDSTRLLLDRVTEDEIDVETDILNLLSFSKGTISITISEFMSMYDWSRLDAAYTNKKKRGELLDIYKCIYDNQYIVYDSIVFDKSCRHIDNALVWIGNRRVNIISLKVLRESIVSDYGLIGLSKHCTSLQSLDISGCNEITDIGIMEVAKSCTSLRSLDISGCHKITGIGIMEVATSCTSLLSLDIRYNKITDNGITLIAKSWTNLQSLDLSNCRNITDTGLTELAKSCTGLLSFEY